MELTEVLKGSAAESFVKFVKYDLENISKTFFDIGFRLWEARDLEYYKELGYESIEELSEAEFDFKRSSTYNLINVFTRFAVYDKCYRNQIEEKFKDYSYSQLVELTKINYLPMHIHDWFPPSAPVREFSAYVRYYKESNQGALKFAEWREQVYLPRLAARSAVQLALPEVQTSGQSEKEDSVPEVQTSGRVEEENTVLEVQTFGQIEKTESVHEVQTSGQDKETKIVPDNNLSCVLESLVKATCDIFDLSIHHKMDNGLFLNVVPSAFAGSFAFILKKHGYTLVKK